MCSPSLAGSAFSADNRFCFSYLGKEHSVSLILTRQSRILLLRLAINICWLLIVNSCLHESTTHQLLSLLPHPASSSSPCSLQLLPVAIAAGTTALFWAANLKKFRGFFFSGWQQSLTGLRTWTLLVLLLQYTTGTITTWLVLSLKCTQIVNKVVWWWQT